MSVLHRMLQAPRAAAALAGDFLTRLGASAKAAAVTFSGSGTGWGVRVVWSHLLRDLGSAREQGESSTLVQACVLWVQRTFPEAPLRVSKIRDDGTLQVDRKHALALLVARPNPFYSGLLLWMGTLADWVLDGNAYWLKVRAKRRADGLPSPPVELWWAPSFMMEPRWDASGRDFISHYEYSPNGVPIRYEVGDVVHFRYGLDARTRKGISPLRSLLLELFTDSEAARFTAALLKNLGIPGVILSSADPKVQLTPGDAEGIKTSYMQKFGGDRRGEPMVLSSPTDVKILSFSPQQLALDGLRDVPEERVAAVLGIPAIVVGFGAGLARSTFANMAEAREAAYESNLIPTQRLFAAEIATQLLPDFSEPDDYLVDFDLSQVRVLQDDQNALHTRAREDLKAGLVTLNQALQMIGMPQEKTGNIRYIPGNLLPTPVGSEVPEPMALPEPTPLLALPPGDDADRDAAADREAELEAAMLERLGRMEQKADEQLGLAVGRIDAAVAALTAARPSNGHTPSKERRLVERDADGLISAVTIEREQSN